MINKSRKPLLASPGNAIGVYRMVITRKTPDGEVVECLPVQKNRLMFSGAQLLASLLIGAEVPSGPCLIPVFRGLLYYAIGSGQSSWDTSGIPLPPVTNAALENELLRTTIGDPGTDIRYVKYGFGSIKFFSDPADPLEGKNYILDPYRFEGGNLVGRFEPDGWYNGLQMYITAGTHAGTTIDIATYTQSDGMIVFSTPLGTSLDDTDEYMLGWDGEPLYVGTGTDPYYHGTEPSNVVEIRVEIPYVHALNGNTLREHALFGGVLAPTIGGRVYNIMRFQPIVKTDTVAMIIFIDLIFRT